MRRNGVGFIAFAIVLTASLSLFSFVEAQPPGGAAPGAPPPQGGPPQGGRPQGPPPAPVDSFVAERDSLVQDLLANRYKGREAAPAESVFKNIKILKGATVEQTLRRMNAYGRSLGVSCKHCHVLGHWDDEDKNTKQIARDMMMMTGKINDELLPAIKNIKSEHPGVNCGTCHGGRARPGFGPMQAARGAAAPGNAPAAPPPPGVKR